MELQLSQEWNSFIISLPYLENEVYGTYRLQRTIQSKTIYESTTGSYRDEDVFLCVLYAHIYTRTYVEI